VLTKKELVIKRSDALKKARHFFYERNYFETDCPILSPYGALDFGIDLFTTQTSPPYFLHSSPEYGMKKCLSEECPSIFQISHVFRQNEKGSFHKQEFMMAEFYKKNTSYADFIEETLDFIELFTGKRKRLYLSYKEAFLQFLNLDPFSQIKEIKQLLEKELSLDTTSLSDDDILSCAMGFFIEKRFDKSMLVILQNFPSTQAALAESFVSKEGLSLAYRFEIYTEHLELANGYKELSDPIELKNRFIQQNLLRQKNEKSSYPIDEELILALNTLPDCCGVACGFDRLMMIHLHQKNIDDVLITKFV
jgi:lysyl-tRNA synthetase class 2